MSEPPSIAAAARLNPHDPADEAAAAEMFQQLGRSLDDREALLRAREQAVAERSTLLAERARELVHVEALVAAREEVLVEREQRVEGVQERLRADAARLGQRYGEFAGAQRALRRAAELDRVELGILAREVALEMREAEWWSKVTGRPDASGPA